MGSQSALSIMHRIECCGWRAACMQGDSSGCSRARTIMLCSMNAGYEDATCVLQLVDNGQLGVHDLLSSSHGPFALPFQAATPITCTATVLVPGTRQPGMPSYSLSMSGLRVLGQEAGRRAAQAYSTAARSVLKALAGGAPAPPPHDATFSIVYATGERQRSPCIRVTNTARSYS
jgi:hypothetical protein